MTTFGSQYGTFQFDAMPFGLMNTPSTLQRMIDRLFLMLPLLLIYLDDVAVFLDGMEKHGQHNIREPDVLQYHGLKLKI